MIAARMTVSFQKPHPLEVLLGGRCPRFGRSVAAGWEDSSRHYHATAARRFEAGEGTAMRNW
jgi:hypothetical protein